MIGANIKKLRMQHGMTQKNLADKLFVSAQAVSRWENNEVEPSISTILELAKIFEQFGEIRQIRPTPSKQNQKFIEFWNTKAAAAAVRAMRNRKRKQVLGSKVAVEFSLPGGYRKNMQSLYETKLPTIERAHRSR